MTTRPEVLQRKRALLAELLGAIDRAELRPGDQITPLAVLSRRHHLSKPTILQVLQPLVENGTLRTVPSVGIFVAHAESPRTGCYVMLVDQRGLRGNFVGPTHSTIHGFEERIAWHGGVSAVVTVDDYLADPPPSLPPVRGLFAFSANRRDELIAGVDDTTRIVVYHAGRADPELDSDPRVLKVDLDNVSGGRLAVEELLRAGHHDITFIGVHVKGRPERSWSRKRAEGWAQAIRRRQPNAHLVAVLPGPEFADDYDGAVAAVARRAADRVPGMAACIGADDYVLNQLIDELTRRGVPQGQWPTMVGFEGLSDPAGHLVTSVRPRWGELGTLAADRLVLGARSRTASLDQVPMSVIARPMMVGFPTSVDESPTNS